MKTLNYRFQQKLEEVFFIEPNDLGFSKLTHVYHRVTSLLKVMPFLWIVPLSFLGSLILYLLLGQYITKLVTLLQYGF